MLPGANIVKSRALDPCICFSESDSKQHNNFEFCGENIIYSTFNLIESIFNLQEYYFMHTYTILVEHKSLLHSFHKEVTSSNAYQNGHT